jgi:hypothetical protein
MSLTVSKPNYTNAIHSEVSGVLNDKGRFVFPGAGDFSMSDPAFNLRGDLLVKLDLVPGQLPIDDDFHLQVAAPNQDFHGQYVKVEKDGDGAAWVLVADKQQASLFQTSNDELRVDVTGMPTGQCAVTGPVSSAESGKPYSIQEVSFSTKETAKTKRTP